MHTWDTANSLTVAPRLQGVGRLPFYPGTSFPPQFWADQPHRLSFLLKWVSRQNASARLSSTLESVASCGSWSPSVLHRRGPPVEGSRSTLGGTSYLHSAGPAHQTVSSTRALAHSCVPDTQASGRPSGRTVSISGTLLPRARALKVGFELTSAGLGSKLWP